MTKTKTLEAPAKKIKYRLLAGSHTEDNVTYEAGDVVPSVHDLLKMNGPEKFALDDAFIQSGIQFADALGDDVSADFDDAESVNLRVFLKKKKYSVFTTSFEPVACRLKKKKQVVAAIIDYLEELESDDEDGDGSDEDTGHGDHE